LDIKPYYTVPLWHISLAALGIYTSLLGVIVGHCEGIERQGTGSIVIDTALLSLLLNVFNY